LGLFALPLFCTWLGVIRKVENFFRNSFHQKKEKRKRRSAAEEAF
jgi:hypothetical protein